MMLLMSDSPHTLRSLGVELQSVIRLNYHSHGFLVTADLPVDLLPEVANMRNVTYIHAARQAKLAAPALDISALATGRESGMGKQSHLYREECRRRHY